MEGSEEESTVSLGESGWVSWADKGEMVFPVVLPTYKMGILTLSGFFLPDLPVFVLLAERRNQKSVETQALKLE